MNDGKKKYQEYRSHPLYKIARAVVFRRANGMCERCKVNPATEPHHEKYPEWDTFDTPSNMVAVCHGCHCIIEGKDDRHTR